MNFKKTLDAIAYSILCSIFLLTGYFSLTYKIENSFLSSRFADHQNTSRTKFQLEIKNHSTDVLAKKNFTSSIDNSHIVEYKFNQYSSFIIFETENFIKLSSFTTQNPQNRAPPSFI